MKEKNTDRHVQHKPVNQWNEPSAATVWITTRALFTATSERLQSTRRESHGPSLSRETGLCTTNVCTGLSAKSFQDVSNYTASRIHHKITRPKKLTRYKRKGNPTRHSCAWQARKSSAALLGCTEQHKSRDKWIPRFVSSHNRQLRYLQSGKQKQSIQKRFRRKVLQRQHTKIHPRQGSLRCDQTAPTQKLNGTGQCPPENYKEWKKEKKKERRN